MIAYGGAALVVLLGLITGSSAELTCDFADTVPLYGTSGGVMFDVESKTNLGVKGLKLYAKPSSELDLRVYGFRGTHEEVQSEPRYWPLLHTEKVAVPSDANSVTLNMFNSPIEMNGEHTPFKYTFYVEEFNGNLILGQPNNQMELHKTGENYMTHDDMDAKIGTLVPKRFFPGKGDLQPAIFVGDVIYDYAVERYGLTGRSLQMGPLLLAPTSSPSLAPSLAPSSGPSGDPTGFPTLSSKPSLSITPTTNPTQTAPPTISEAPSDQPSPSPSDIPSDRPSKGQRDLYYRTDRTAPDIELSDILADQFMPIIESKHVGFAELSCANYGIGCYNEYKDITYNINTPEDKELLISKGIAITPEMEALSQGKKHRDCGMC